MERYGYYATHGGYANYNNGFAGMKYRKTRKNEYIAPQGLAHNNTKLSENSAPKTSAPVAVNVSELVNEIVIDNNTKSNEEMRLNALNAPELEFAGDSKKSNVKMVIQPLKPAAAAKSIPLRKDDGQMPVKFDG